MHKAILIYKKDIKNGKEIEKGEFYYGKGIRERGKRWYKVSKTL